MPDWKAEILSRLASQRLEPQREAAIVEEMAQHLDDCYAEHRSKGLDDAAARAAALAELSGLEAFAPTLRRVAGRPSNLALGRSSPSVVETVVHDVRYALRTFRSSPAFAAVAVLTFAVGIGACTLMFSAVQGVLRRSLPYHEPDQLVAFWGTAPEKGLPEVSMPTGMFEVYRTRTRTLTKIAAFSSFGATLTSGSGDPERTEGAEVSQDFFGVLAVPPRFGRTFSADETAREAAPTVVLSHALWQRRYSGDTTLVGRTIEVNSRAATVVGIMPPGFDFPRRAQIWRPLFADPNNFGCWCFDLLGRMRPGLGAQDVAREMMTITDDFGLQRRDVFPDAKRGGSRMIAMPLAERIAGDLQRPLLVLLGAVGLVLLIGCANIANLVLVRATSRQQELAMRCCLGAGPRRIAAQLLIESLVLSVSGAVAGFALASWGMQLLRRLPVDQFPRISEVRVDPVVLAFTAGVAVITGLLCGLAPALRVSRLQLHDAVRSGARSSGGAAARRWSDGFVITQFTLSLVLLVGAGLLLRSYQRLTQLDLGFKPENVLVGRISLPYPKYDTSTTVWAFYNPLLDRVRAIPGVTNVGLASRVPLARGNPQNNVVAEGKEPRPGEPVRVTNVRIVTPGYFAAIGTPILEGRDFQASDDPRNLRVAVVDDAFAKHFWPNESAIGKRVRGPSDTSANRWITIVGVVRNVKHNRLDEATDIQLYESFTRYATWNNYLVVRSSAATEELTSRIRAELKALDPTLPFYEVRTMQEAVSASLGIRRLTNILLVGFALVALLLAAIGIYGVIALSVSARVREFGVRMALGAKTSDIKRMVLRYGLGLAAAGVTIGLAGALYLTRFLQKLLFNVAPFDPPTVVTVAAVLTVTAVLASYLPARRATRADPVLALRAE
jgi:putative ABC transport system permease protein